METDLANQALDMPFLNSETAGNIQILLSGSNCMSQSNENIGKTESAQPFIVEGFFKDGKIASHTSFAEITDRVFEGRIVIIKGVFEPEMLLDFRRGLVNWWKNNPPFPHGKSPSTEPEVNYHRIDDGVIKSVCPHIFHQAGFNRLDKLSDEFAQPAQVIAESMKDLQNEVAGTDFDISLNGLRLKVLQYPVGGGFLAEHTHPLEPQRIGLIMSLSRIGEDFASGGTFFQTPFGRVDTLAYHDIGDIILFRYDLPHAVAVVDEDNSLDWNADTGKWSVVLELRETHGLSHKA
jgi:hypothetical protein